MRIRITAPSKTRPSAFKLKDALIERGYENTKLIKKNIKETSFVKTGNDFVINWGMSKQHELTEKADMNDYKRVTVMSDKLAFFRLMKAAGEWGKTVSWLDPVGFNDRLPAGLLDGLYVLRTTLTGSGGKGIYVIRRGEDNVEVMYPSEISSYEIPWRDVELITEYYKAKYEFRFHVVGGKCIHVQRKALRTDELRPENPQFYVRNHDNGFIFEQGFSRELDEPVTSIARELEELSKKFKFDIVAYDVRMKEDCDWKIIEANSAPGLEGTTLEKYADRISEIISEKIR